MQHPRSDRNPVGPAFPGPLLLLFPLLLLAAAIQYQRTRRPDPGAHPAQPEEQSVALVPGWLGRGELASGAQLRVRFSRLHADESWQSFDAASLTRRLNLDAGEPWRLELSVDGEGELPPIELAGLAVLDSTGSAAALLEVLSPDTEASIVDPLWGALASPHEVHPGETARLFLWGRSPEGAAALRGSFGEVALFPESISAEGSESVLASLEEQE